MNIERWRRIEALFLEAVELDPRSRAAWLDRECGDDAELRSEVNRLLAADTDASPALYAAVASSIRELDEARESQVSRIGPYEVLAEIGRGGMGIVYRARRDDDVFQKEVAIKVVKRGMDTEQILTRFVHERRILARLEHPSIARIIDGGTTESGLPYLVMEYVEGRHLTDFASQQKLSLNARLDLFCKVCAAVEYAHQHLVVHRDLKPSNILVDTEGTPKLLDFGIAKLLDSTEGQSPTLTSPDTRILTPQYASPEQVSGEPITTASDIYSLGTILYELLTGKTAHHITAHTPLSLQQAICEEEVVPPSRAARLAVGPPFALRELLGDLDNIVLMALRKDRRERYGSVHLLCEDLRRFMKDMPVLARPQTIRYRAVKFLRRNRIPVIAASLAAASLIGGTAVSVYQARRAERRFQEVRTLAHSVLFEIHDQIEQLPGTTAVRELMIRTVLRYLNNLAREAGDDASLQWELATAYSKVGDVQGYAVRPNLGQFAGAMDSHRKALAIAELLAARGYDPKVQRLLALAHHRVGYLELGTQSSANVGMEHYNRSLEIFERLNQQSPGDSENSPLLISLHGHRGDAHIAYGRPADAAASWERALEVAEQWYRRIPSVAATQALGNAHGRVSRAAQLTGDLDKALDHARLAIAIHEPLAAAQPANVALQRDLMNAYEQMSFVAAFDDYLNLGDRATALVYTRRVVAIAQDLLNSDPKNFMAASDLQIAKRSACIFLPDENTAALIRDCQDLLDTADRKGWPAIDYQPAVAMRLGPALAKIGRHAEAARTMDQAVAHTVEALEKWPWRADFRRLLMRVHNRYGAMLSAMGKPAEALKQYRQGVAIGEALLPSQPNDLTLRRDLADCYTSIGRYVEKQDPLQARGWYRKDLDIWMEWPRFAASGHFDQARREQAIRSLARCAAGQAPTN